MRAEVRDEAFASRPGYHEGALGEVVGAAARVRRWPVRAWIPKDEDDAGFEDKPRSLRGMRGSNPIRANIRRSQRTDENFIRCSRDWTIVYIRLAVLVAVPKPPPACLYRPSKRIYNSVGATGIASFLFLPPHCGIVSSSVLDPASTCVCM